MYCFRSQANCFSHAYMRYFFVCKCCCCSYAYYFLLLYGVIFGMHGLFVSRSVVCVFFFRVGVLHTYAFFFFFRMHEWFLSDVIFFFFLSIYCVFFLCMYVVFVVCHCFSYVSGVSVHIHVCVFVRNPELLCFVC